MEESKTFFYKGEIFELDRFPFNIQEKADKVERLRHRIQDHQDELELLTLACNAMSEETYAMIQAHV